MAAAARLIELNAREKAIREEHAALLEPSAVDKRNLTPEEIIKADALQAELTQVVATRKHIQVSETSADTGRPEQIPGATEAPKAESKMLAFGRFLQGVAAASGYKDLGPQFNAAASGLNTGTGAEGGFLVRTDFSTMLLDKAMTESVLAPLCSSVTLSEGSDSFEAPYIDETSRATGSRFGGVRIYRAGEADTVTASKPKFGRFEIRLEDLMGIAYATERSLRDAGVLAQVIAKSFASEFAYTIDDEILNGDGNARCLGILNSPATVSVAKEASQVAATIVAENILKMHSRMPAKMRNGAVWIHNQDCEPQFPQMNIKVKNVAGSENVGGLPIFSPPNVLSPVPSLYGKPLVAAEQAKTLGTVGDLYFANLSEYLLVKKGGLEMAESVHVRFLYNEKTFRFIFPINGAPTWKSALTPANGSNPLSPFVSLATRA